MIGFLEAARMASALDGRLASAGVEVRQIVDFAEVRAIVEGLGKDYLTPVNSPLLSDMLESNCLGLVGVRGGAPVFFGIARLEDLTVEPVNSWWVRMLGRAYGRDVVAGVNAGAADLMRGRLVYFGDLFVAPGARGVLQNVRDFVALGHLMVAARWSPDVTYCFVRERDVMRGAAARYGFSRLMPSPLVWRDPPPVPRSNSEWLAYLPRADLLPMVRAAVSGGNQGGVGQD